MDFLRKIVSGPKKRFKEDGYNLDLTYVCPRLIAMSFPASGIETLYRNDIDNVSSMIRKKHGGDYMIINLSGRKYNYSKFEDKVLDFEWEDHHSPPINTLFIICHKIHQFLKGKIENVAIIHCLAGKGRTGTIICCYMMYSGRFKTPQEALMYYGKKRFLKEGLGVNQPCQIRYVYYFHQLLTEHNVFPTLKYIKSVKLKGRPKISDDGCRPFVDLTSVHTKQKLFSTKKSHSDQLKFIEGEEFTILFDNPKPICGDILLRMKNNGTLSNKVMFRISFNTAFVKLDNQILKDTRIPKEFEVTINFADACKCNCYTSFEDKCSACKTELLKEITAWKEIYAILQNYSAPHELESQELLFGNETEDVDEILNQQRKNYFETQVALGQDIEEGWEKMSNQYILEFYQRNEGNNCNNSSSDDDEDRLQQQQQQEQEDQLEQDNEEQKQQFDGNYDSPLFQHLQSFPVRFRSGTESQSISTEAHTEFQNQASRKRSVMNPNIYEGILQAQELYAQQKLQQEIIKLKKTNSNAEKPSNLSPTILKTNKTNSLDINTNTQNASGIVRQHIKDNISQYVRSKSQYIENIQLDDQDDNKDHEEDDDDNEEENVINEQQNIRDRQKSKCLGLSPRVSPGHSSSSSDSFDLTAESKQQKNVKDKAK